MRHFFPNSVGGMMRIELATLRDALTHKVRTYKEYHSVRPSSELGLLPTPHPQASVPPPPCFWGGGEHSLARKGLGESQFRRGAYTVVLFICTYFVVDSIQTTLKLLLPSSKNWMSSLSFSSGNLEKPLKGTQDWEFFWLRFWIVCYFNVSYAQILRFCKKTFFDQATIGGDTIIPRSLRLS